MSSNNFCSRSLACCHYSAADSALASSRKCFQKTDHILQEGVTAVTAPMIWAPMVIARKSSSKGILHWCSVSGWHPHLKSQDALHLVTRLGLSSVSLTTSMFFLMTLRFWKELFVKEKSLVLHFSTSFFNGLHCALLVVTRWVASASADMMFTLSTMLVKTLVTAAAAPSPKPVAKSARLTLAVTGARARPRIVRTPRIVRRTPGGAGRHLCDGAVHVNSVEEIVVGKGHPQTQLLGLPG